jgi:hypothetical protein
LTVVFDVNKISYKIFAIFILVEDHTEDEILGCLQFVSNYRDLYGPVPNFFEGTLEDAVKTACSAKSAKDVILI